MRFRLLRILRSLWRDVGICRTIPGSARPPSASAKAGSLYARWALYDLNSPRGFALRESVLELLAAVDAVSKDVSQLGKAAAQLLQQWNGAMAVLNIGWMDIDGEQKAIGVGDDMPLTPVNTFA